MILVTQAQKLKHYEVNMWSAVPMSPFSIALMSGLSRQSVGASNLSIPGSSSFSVMAKLVKLYIWSREQNNCLYDVCFFTIRNFIKKHSEPLTFFPKHAPNRDIHTSHLQGQERKVQFQGSFEWASHVSLWPEGGSLEQVLVNVSRV